MPRRMHGPQGCALSGDDIPIAKEPARGGGGGAIMSRSLQGFYEVRGSLKHVGLGFMRASIKFHKGFDHGLRFMNGSARFL